MKTLKKTLCLVLAVVMVVGVLILPASAADYEDDAEITHKEAVAVLSKLEILTGNAGSYHPDETLSRAEAASIISKLAQTPAVANRYPKGQATGFADVDSNDSFDWATGFIAYCATKGIISGNGTNYYPLDKLTGTAFAKMLLCTVGYNAETEGFVGNLWAVNVIGTAIKVGLDEGIEDFDYEAPLSRDNAAQMAYNALTAAMVVYDNGKAVEQTTGTGDEKTAVTLNSQNKYGVTVVAAADLGHDAAGAPKTRIVKVGNDVVIDVTATAQWTYNTAKKFSDILKDVKGDKATAADMPAKYFVNGVASRFSDSEPYGSEYSAAPIDTLDSYACALGSTTSVYTVKEGGKDVYYIVRLTDKYITVDDTATTGNYKDGTLTVDKTNKVTTKIEAKKGDVVVYTLGKNDKNETVVVDAYVASTITGAITAKNATQNYIRIDNSTTTYKIANTDITIGNLTVNEKVNKVFHLDKNGNIVGVTDPDNGSSSEDETLNYAYVLQTQTKAAGGDGHADLFGEVKNPSADAAKKAQLLFLDGTSKVVDVAVVKAAETSGSIEKGKWYLADADGNPIGSEITGEETSETGFVSYEETSRGYVLTSVSTVTAVNVTAGKASVSYTDTTAKTAYGTTTSVLTVITHDTSDNKNEYTAVSYTGYTKFVKVENATGVLDADTKGNINRLVVLVEKTGSGQTTGTDTVRGVYVGPGDEIQGGYNYDFIVDGKVVTYKSASQLTTLGDSAKGTVVGVQLSKADGTISGIVAADGKVDTTGEFDQLSDDKAYIVVDDTVYYLAANCVIVDAHDAAAAAVVAELPAKTATVEIYKVGGTDENTADQINLIVVKTLNP